MEEILKQFLQFVKTTNGYGRDVFVDLESFKKNFQRTTPVKLPLSDPNYAFLNMPAVIVVNFARNQLSSVEKYGLDAVKRIVTKDASDADSKIQLMLMVHVAKLINLPDPAKTYDHIEGTTLVKVDENVRAWVDIALNVLRHTEIGTIIKEAAKRIFGPTYSERISQSDNISVQMFESNELHLRGFAGLDSVYINMNYFKSKAFDLSMCKHGSDIEKGNMILIDIATVCLHVLGQLKIRKAFDNLNVSTMLQQSDGDEFGRIIETQMFGVVPDWKTSFEQERISPNFVAQFLESINNNLDLPILPPGTELKKRGSRTMEHASGGVDFEFLEDYTIE